MDIHNAAESQGPPERPLAASIIIPAFGQTPYLKSAIRSALAQDLAADQFEVIVVDSSPDPANRDLVRSLEGEAACSLRVFWKEPEGPGPSRNLGAHNARGGILAFLDSDCVASTGWLSHGLAAFSDSGIGLVQGRTQADPSAPHSVFNRTLVIAKENHIYETANIFYPRDVFEQFHGFLSDSSTDPTHTLIGGEDVDLAWRVKRAGFSSVFAPDALVTHAVFRLAIWRWFCEMRLGSIPMIVRKYPELRRFYYMRYFFDEYQAKLLLLLAALPLSFVHLAFLSLAVPYLIARGAQPSRTLKGPLRLLRAGLYLPRDLYTFWSLLVGSVRYRALML